MIVFGRAALRLHVERVSVNKDICLEVLVYVHVCTVYRYTHRDVVVLEWRNSLRVCAQCVYGTVPVHTCTCNM